MRKHILLPALALCLLGAVVALAQSYGVVNVQAPGVVEPIGIGVAKVTQISVYGSAVADGTVIISRISADNAATNTIATLTCSGGKAMYDETNAVYLVVGDKILRTGTATNGPARIILTQ